MRPLRAALAARRHEGRDRHAQRQAGAAAVAVRPVGEHAAAPKAVGDQARVGVGVDQVAGRGDLRAGHPAGDVAAGVRRGRVELQRGERKFFRVCHRDAASSADVRRDAELPPQAQIIGPILRPEASQVPCRDGCIELGARHLPAAERGEVGGALLAVDRLDAAVAAEGDQRRQRDLRGIGAAREHRLAEEHPAERDAVEAAGELAVDPGLDAVHPAERRARRQ